MRFKLNEILIMVILGERKSQLTQQHQFQESSVEHFFLFDFHIVPTLANASIKIGIPRSCCIGFRDQSKVQKQG